MYGRFEAGALLPLREDILARISDRDKEDRWPVTPQRLVHDVRQVIPEDGIIALDNGMYKIWFARNYRTYVANTVLRDNALATMGAELPSAIMAAMLYPDRRVMAVCGDGGFMMNSQELETAVWLKLNLVVLILNDGAFGMIRWKQAADSFADFGLTFGAQSGHQPLGSVDNVASGRIDRGGAHAAHCGKAIPESVPADQLCPANKDKPMPGGLDSRKGGEQASTYFCKFVTRVPDAVQHLIRLLRSCH